MNRKLDLNALEQPVFELTLPDEKKTLVRITIPEEKLIERFMVASGELKAVQDSQDAGSIKALYELTADLFNNNADGLRFTAEELRDKYRVRFVHLIFIFRDYLDFIHDIQNEKN